MWQKKKKNYDKNWGYAITKVIGQKRNVQKLIFKKPQSRI